MLLRGTKKRRSAFDISVITDRAGASYNAFTGQERIYFFIQVTKQHLETMVELLADIILNPLFNEEVLENEKQVILQELHRAQDNHLQFLGMKSMENVFKDHPLANIPLGNRESVLLATPEKLRDYHANFFKPSRAAFIASGTFDHQKIAGLVNSYFNEWSDERPTENKTLPIIIKGGYVFEKVPGKQTHLAFNFATPKINFRESLILDLIANYLSYGHTSLLYQELRHKQGLAYYISAYSHSFQDANIFYIRTATDKPKQVISAVLGAIQNFERHFTPPLLPELKEQMRSILLRQLNDPLSEIKFIGTQWVLYGRLISPNEVETAITTLTYKEIVDSRNKCITKDNFVLVVLGEEDIDTGTKKLLPES